MNRSVIWTSQFKRDYKQAQKRGLNIALLDECITKIATNTVLSPSYRDHELTGRWAGFRECHILPDWLLVYRLEDDDLILVLARTGTHSDLF